MRFKSLFLASLLMLVSAVPAMAAATLTIGNASYTAGGTVTVPINYVAGGANISMLSLDIDYDTTKLSSPVGTIGPAASTGGKALSSNILSSTGTGKYRILISGGMVIAGSYDGSGVYTPSPDDKMMDTTAGGKSSVLSDGVVAFIKFNVAGGTTGSITLGGIVGAATPEATEVVIAGVPAAVLTPGTAGKPGDCNNDGRVSVIEIQNATNMLLRKIAVLLCADPDGNGRVSVIEIQNMVNALLGKPY
jgi:hypothetical protein